MKNQLAFISRVALLLSAGMLLLTIFVPIWRIELTAPQYPEGLVMLIYASKLGGQVEIINGLNHYIGMATLHAENFIEFTVLPYIIGGFVLLMLLAAAWGKKRGLYFAFGALLVFGILAMVDFWRWEYNYGHNLDPNAAIVVPGMAYQPPLIGFKQLLNFGAYSIPDLGGWMFVLSGLALLLAVGYEAGWLGRIWPRLRPHTLLSGVFLALSLAACSQNGPEPLALHQDQCDFCKMTIADGRFGAELITAKGRVYKFDDLSCLVRYAKQETSAASGAQYFVCDYRAKNTLRPVDQVFFLHDPALRSPMAGNVAAFATRAALEAYWGKPQAPVLSWAEAQKQLQ